MHLKGLVSELGIALIKHFEGFRSEPYLCAGGYRTIGYGHVIRPGEALQSVTEAEAEALLFRDLTLSERAILRLITVPLTSHQFDALASFTFNLGSGALQSSTLRQKVNRQEHEDAAQEFHRWVYAGGRKLAGLVRRRRLESLLYSGEADLVKEILNS